MIVDTKDVFDRGVKAGESGKTQKSCPYTQADLRRIWIAGWRTGKEQKAST